MIPRSPKSDAQRELRAACSMTGKKRYRSEEAATRALGFADTMRALGNTAHRERRAYECEHCTGWHLTSKPYRMPVRSAKTAKHYRDERIPFLVEMLEEFPVCQIQFDERCTQIATTVHEKRKKSQGGSDVDRANCLSSCSFCNFIIEDEPIEAHERGFVLWAGESA